MSAEQPSGQAGGTERGMSMIDKGRVEDLLQDADESEAADREFMRVRVASIHGLLAEHRDLLAIVEALAARVPAELVTPGGEEARWVCFYCYQVSFGGRDSIAHRESCPYRRAVALIGPAGERAEGE